jgi:ribose-phosphate pyrophosphokinase
MIYLNGAPVEYFTFPGGELAPRIPEGLPRFPVIEIKVHGDETSTIFNLALIVDALRRRDPLVQLELAIPYLPYARQDRVCNPGEPLAVSVMADLINSLGFRRVEVMDCHSDVGSALIRNCRSVPVAEVLARALPALAWNKVTLVAPDAGAVKKVHEAARNLGADGVVCCSKVRDTATGNISHVEVPGDLGGKYLLVVDDIFDGGRTFIELGRALRQQNPAGLGLWVTHGIFSKGYDEVAAIYDSIDTTNSFHHAAKGNTRPDGIVDPQFSFFEI